MKFSEAWHKYVDVLHPVKTTVFCTMTKIDIMDDVLYRRRDIPEGDLKYYLRFMDSLGNIEEPNGFVCYDVYKKIYSNKWERDLRARMIEDKKANQLLCKKFNIPARYEGVTFKSINKFPEQKELLNASQGWAKDGFRENYLIGSDKSNGIGKTTMAVCLAMEWYVNNDARYSGRYYKDNMSFLNQSILFIKEPELAILIPNEYDFTPVHFRGEVIQRIANIDFLVYDDMLRVNDDKYVRRFLYPLIEMRLEDGKKPTVFTTALPQQQFKMRYPDLWSRMNRGKILYPAIKTDFRIKK